MSDHMAEATPLSRFFQTYADRSLGSDPAALAALYAPAFIVAGPQGSRSFANDERFVEWLGSVRDFNREHGMRSLEPIEVDETALSPLHSLAIVRWGVRFEKTGTRLITFQISYLMEKAGASWKILSYVSEADQDEAMKNEGV